MAVELAMFAPYMREVESPLTDLMLRPPGPECDRVQFQSALTDYDYARLGEWMEQYPSMALRAYGHDSSVHNLDFLRYFPRLLEFSVDLYRGLESLEGLRFLPPTARALGIGPSHKRLSLRPLEHFVNLQHLLIAGQAKHIDVLAKLHSLCTLTLGSVPLKDLSFLEPLTDLRALNLRSGSTPDLSQLPTIGRLEYLELWMVRGLSNLSPISELKDLSYLHLESLGQVERLPDLTELHALETIWLQSMKSLVDLSPLLSAPALRHVGLVAMPHLQPENVSVLSSSNTLEGLRIDLGSRRKNAATQKLVPLAEANWERWPRPAFLY